MFSVEKKIHVYYISYYDRDEDYSGFNNRVISKILKIDIDSYRAAMIDRYGGNEYNDFVYFLEEDKAKQACEWIEMVYITNNKLG